MIRAGLLVIHITLLVTFFLTCVLLEHRRRQVVVLGLVLGVVLLDATFYADTQASFSASIFHPHLLGQNFRLTQLILPVALLARLAARGLPRRVDRSTPLWLAFFAWVVVSTIVGLMHGYAPPVVLRQASVIINLGGGLALAAGVPAHQFVTGTAVPRFLQIFGAIASLLFLTDSLGVRVSSKAIPDLPLNGFGAYGADAATLFSSIGVLGLVLESGRYRRAKPRLSVLVPSVLLVLSHLASPQRAARLDLYLTLLILVLMFLSPTGVWRNRLRLARAGAVAAALAVAGLSAVLAVAVVEATVTPESSVAAGGGKGLLGANTRQGSIESRYNQWSVVWDEIKREPLLGEGLGGTFVHYEEGKKEFVEGDIAHNIGLDLLRRTGFVGLLLGAAGVLIVCGDALRVWHRHPDNRIASLAAAAFALTAGLVAKGMVESIFEKYRVAVLLGCVLGLAVSASLARHAAGGDSTWTVNGQSDSLPEVLVGPTE